MARLRNVGISPGHGRGLGTIPFLLGHFTMILPETDRREYLDRIRELWKDRDWVLLQAYCPAVSAKAADSYRAKLALAQASTCDMIRVLIDSSDKQETF